MDYEKEYKAALERAKQWYNAPNVDKIPTFANRVIEEIFPELKESEDERIRKDLITFLDDFYLLGKNTNFDKWSKADCSTWIAWLEKMEEHLKFCKTIQIGDRVTRNEGGVLVNMSQFDRIAKPRKIESISSELKDSEGERIRKEIIEVLCNFASMHYPLTSIERHNEWIAWLENLAPNPQGKSALEEEKEREVWVWRHK